LARKHGLYEAWHLISRDGGNITMFFKREPPQIDPCPDTAIPGNYEWISKIVRRHTNFAHHLTPSPYVRVWQRLCRSLTERRETAGAESGRALLDGVYAKQVQAHSVAPG
jgi:hypothetical protein